MKKAQFPNPYLTCKNVSVHEPIGCCRASSGEKEQAKPILENALQLAIEQKHEGPEGELRTLVADL